MTITTEQSSVTYAGNGATTNFPFSFLIPAASDLQVVLTTPTATGVLAQSLYTASGFGNPNGGSVTYNPSGGPLASGSSLTIERVLPIEQDTDLINQNGYYPEVVEAALDYGIMVAQQQEAQLVRALLANPGDTVALVPLPPAASRANQLLGFDTTGQPFLYPPIAGSFTPGGVVAITGGTIDNTVIGGTIPAAGTFTTINGVTVTWTAGKTFTLAYSLTINGGDVTITGSGNNNTLTLPSQADTLVGRNTVDVLTNKTIQSDTIVGTKIATSPSQLLGFYNATPVAQQASTGTATGFTTGAGTTVHDDSTFTGAVGSTAYRISDIVKALKNLGLIAQ